MEVLNIDVEGCLVLCDVLIYVECFELECVVDVVMLTGVCVIVLGYYISVVMLNYNLLVYELVNVFE